MPMHAEEDRPAAPDASRREKATGQNGQPAPPGVRKPGSRVVRPDSDKGSGGRPPEEIESPDDPPKMAIGTLGVSTSLVAASDAKRG